MGGGIGMEGHEEALHALPGTITPGYMHGIYGWAWIYLPNSNGVRIEDDVWSRSGAGKVERFHPAI